MNKRKIRKAAYKAIVKEDRTHQETFDTLRNESSIELEALAEEVSKIPSKDKSEKQQTLRYIFIGVLCLIMVIRTLGIIGLGALENFNMSLVLILVVTGLLIPILGIVGALISKVEYYKTVGFLLAYGIFKSLTRDQLPSEPIEFLIYIPFIVAIALAFYIPTKLKTAYKKTVKVQDIDGQQKKSIHYDFDNSKEIVDDNILDVELK